MYKKLLLGSLLVFAIQPFCSSDVEVAKPVVIDFKQDVAQQIEPSQEGNFEATLLKKVEKKAEKKKKRRSIGEIFKTIAGCFVSGLLFVTSFYVGIIPLVAALVSVVGVALLEFSYWTLLTIPAAAMSYVFIYKGGQSLLNHANTMIAQQQLKELGMLSNSGQLEVVARNKRGCKDWSSNWKATFLKSIASGLICSTYYSVGYSAGLGMVLAPTPINYCTGIGLFGYMGYLLAVNQEKYE